MGLIEEHYGALEADFLREYNLHLGDCLNVMGARRIEALINGLPPTSVSAVARALNENVREGWGYPEELLSVLIEVVDAQSRNFLAAHGVKKHQLPKPIRINRPLEPERRREATPADLKTILGGAPVIKAQKETDV